MARDQEPMTEGEREAAKDEIHAAFNDVRDDLEQEPDGPVSEGGK